MKKLVSAVLALTLTLGMGLTAMAAPSPEKGNNVTDATATTVVDGKEVEVAVTVEKIKDEAVKVEAAEKEANALAPADTKVTVLASAEVDAKGVTVSEKNPLTIVFTVPTVQKGWTVYALHQKKDGTWERLSTVVNDGTVTVKFTSLSPVVFVREETVASTPTTGSAQPIYSPEWYEQQKALYAGSNAASNASANAATNAGITSPKTGE